MRKRASARPSRPPTNKARCCRSPSDDEPARLLADKGGTTKARALLQPTVESITEGRDLSDFKAAAALLAVFGTR
jgi:hypothetical protein